MPARICCLDLDTFFVSVERLLDPTLAGLPVVVGGRRGERGVVTAASYEVRRFGVHSGMPMGEASRLAPDAIFLPTRHSTYSPYAKEVRAVLDRFCPEVRTASIDEFFLDFTGCEELYRRPGDVSGDATILRVVGRMREAIQEEVGLPASAGIAAGRSAAKIASGLAKPAGVLLIPRGAERRVLGSLPARKVPGIGPVTERHLAAAGVHTISDLLSLRAGPRRARFGGLAERVRDSLEPRGPTRLGRDRPAFLEHDQEGGTVGSISNERTFHADVGDRARVLAQLRALTERVCWRARRRGVEARTVTLKLRFSDFHTVSRSRTDLATHAEDRIFRTVQALYRRAQVRRLPVRLVGVQLSNLVHQPPQLPLPLGRPPRPAAGAALDAVRARFGYDAIRLGAAGGRTRWLATPSEPGGAPS